MAISYICHALITQYSDSMLRLKHRGPGLFVLSPTVCTQLLGIAGTLPLKMEVLFLSVALGRPQLPP